MNGLFSSIRAWRKRRRHDRLLRNHLRKTIDWISDGRATIRDFEQNRVLPEEFRDKLEVLRITAKEAIEIRAGYLGLEHKTPQLRATIEDLAVLADEARDTIAVIQTFCRPGLKTL